MTQFLDLTAWHAKLPKRKADAHKGNFGRVLVVGGAPGFSGAARLAGEAALRAGAGLVKVATHPEHAHALNAERPELMIHAVSTAADLKPLLDEATVVILGPGLGQSDWSHTLYDTVIATQKPMVVDADALNCLSKAPQALPHAILTPHPGEAARLLNIETETIQMNREQAIQELSQMYRGIIVLKGHHTLVSDGHTIYECAQGNPGMATAGMGDVLSGVIGGLMPQMKTHLDAACLGVLVHATAGDMAATAGERGMIASDLFPYIPQLLN